MSPKSHRTRHEKEIFWKWGGSSKRKHHPGKPGALGGAVVSFFGSGIVFLGFSSNRKVHPGKPGALGRIAGEIPQRPPKSSPARPAVLSVSG